MGTATSYSSLALERAGTFIMLTDPQESNLHAGRNSAFLYQKNIKNGHNTGCNMSPGVPMGTPDALFIFLQTSIGVA